MNSPVLTPPPTESSSESASTEIAIHLGFLRHAEFLAAMGLNGPVIIPLLVGQLKAALARESLATEEIVGNGDICDGLLLFSTNRREAALQVIKSQLTAEPSIFDGGSTIAWYDASEGAWRVVKQGLDTDSFESRLTPARSEFRHEISVRNLQICRDALAVLRQSIKQ